MVEPLGDLSRRNHFLPQPVALLAGSGPTPCGDPGHVPPERWWDDRACRWCRSRPRFGGTFECRECFWAAAKVVVTG